jgi:hypothetical protein
MKTLHASTQQVSKSSRDDIAHSSETPAKPGVSEDSTFLGKRKRHPPRRSNANPAGSRSKRMVPCQPGRQHPVASPHLPPRIVAENRLDHLAHGLSDNDLHPLMSFLRQLRLAPGQTPQVRSRYAKFLRRPYDVAKMLSQSALNQTKIKTRAASRNLRNKWHRYLPPLRSPDDSTI